MFDKLGYECFRLTETEVNKLKNFRKDPVESAKLHLVRAYGLASIYKICKGSKGFLKDGFDQALQWRDNRGRPIALKIALSWLGIDSFMLVTNGDFNRWNAYQIGLYKKIDKATVKKIKKAMSLSAPARAIFERIFLIKDNTKKLKLSCSESSLSRNILSTDSGAIEKGGFVNDVC